MIVQSYHTHTPRCHHAVGDERAYIEAAIAAGVKVLGFSDHAPQFYDNGFVSTMRMTPAEAVGYVDVLRRLGEEYKNDITLYVGFEAEYFPALFPRLRDFCRELGVDYLLLGQHCLTDEREGLWVSRPHIEKTMVTRYVDEVIEGLGTGAFTYLCHPDVCRCPVGEEDFYLSEMTRLFLAAKESSIPLEFNLLGMRERRRYPSDAVFALAAKIGNDVILGRDAHEPTALGESEVEDEGRRRLAALGITPIEAVTLRRPY